MKDQEQLTLGIGISGVACTQVSVRTCRDLNTGEGVLFALAHGDDTVACFSDCFPAAYEPYKHFGRGGGHWERDQVADDNGCYCECECECECDI